MSQLLGRVAAPPDCESTSGEFYFWVCDGCGVERTQIVTTKCTIGDAEVTFVGVVQEVYRRSRAKDIGEESDRYDGGRGGTPPFDSAGITYAQVTVLRTVPTTHAPPCEESTVYLGGPADAATGYAFDRMRPENKLALGRLRNGGQKFAGPAVIDLAYLLGENGGHLNVNGIAGMGAKSSFLLHVNQLLLAWARNQPVSSRTQIVPVIFNVKNFDLCFIDRHNRNWKPEHTADWEELGVPPRPFEGVKFYAAQERNRDTPIRTGRDVVTPYSWGLADVVAQGAFRYLFVDDDLGTPNFGGLVAAVEDALTYETAEVRKLSDGAPKTFDELLEALKDKDGLKGISEFTTGTRLALVRRLKGMLLDADGVLRRCEPKGKPLEMPGSASGPLVIDLYGVRDEKLKRFVVAAVFQQLIEFRSRNPVEGLRYLVTLDELNRFAPKGETDAITRMIERVAAEMRSQGILLLGAQQEASRVSPRVIENSAVRVVGRSGTLELSADVWKFLGPAGRQQAAQLLEDEKLIVLPSFRAPLLAKIPFPPYALRKEEAATPPAPANRFAATEL